MTMGVKRDEERVDAVTALAPAEHAALAPLSPRRSLLVLALALGACAPPAARGSGYCAPPAVAPSFVSDPAPGPDVARDERVAALLGLRPEWTARVVDDAGRARVLARIEQARLAIAGIRAELDCDGESAEEVADSLSRAQSDTTQTLTVGSIAAAGVTGIVSVFLSTSQSSAGVQDGVAIGGGVVTAGLSGGSLFVHPHVHFEHARNLLTDVWNGPAQSTTYPPFVWGYLNEPALSNEQRESIRARIVGRWRQLQGVGDDAAQVALLFGTGGSYDTSTLRLRAQMLDEVKAEVDLMNQEIAVVAARWL